MATVTTQPVARRRDRTGNLQREKGMSLPALIAMYTVLTVVGLLAAFPFYWMLVASTHRSATILTSPPPLVFGGALLQNYQELTSQINFWRTMWNSVLVSGISTILTLFFCSLGGYGFAKFQFPGRDKLFGMMLATMMIPGILGIIPSFMLMRWLGWLNPDWRNYLPLIVPGVASAFGIFWMRQYIQSSIPNDLMDAARIDGASEFAIYRRIMLPQMGAVLATLGIFTFMATWNDYLWPLIVMTDPNKLTLQVALQQLNGVYGTDYSMVMAGALMSVVPLIGVFLIGGRHFIADLAAGAMKF
jgi:ABC-type glycerol-3-phosphate transport system permease component